MPLFAILTKERICSEIDAAQRHVILAAPGIGMLVANALLQASQRLQKGAVQVALDVSPSVARLGYGEHAAVEKLTAAGIALRQHAGLRIGVLICDDAGWSFATSPSLVEADPVGEGDAFNAIALTAAQVMVLRAELPAITKGSQQEPAPEYAVVGTELVSEATLNKVKRALDIAPPQQFDLARQTQVYAALIQFVELTFEGFNIQSRRVQLPKSLPLIASKDKALKDRLTASLKVLDQIEKPKALREVTAKLEELRNAYLVPVGQAGRIMLKSKRVDFEKELKAIEDSLEACKKSLVTDLQEALQNVVNAIVPDLARAVMDDPPPRFRGLFPETEESAAEFVKGELAKAFPTADELVSGMKIHKFYKDVTYETLKNKDFSERVMNEIPSSVLEGSLLQEHMAAKSGKVMS
jgi:hypothetical protein